MSLDRVGLRTAIASSTGAEPPAGVGAYDIFNELAQAAEADARQLRHRQQAVARVQELHRKWEAEKRKLFGPDLWGRKEQFARSRRQDLKSLRQQTNESQKLATFRQETSARSAELMGGLNRASLQAAHQSHLKEFRDAIQAPLAELPAVEVLEEDQVPEVIRFRRHNPPFTAVPPYLPANPASDRHYWPAWSAGTGDLLNFYVDPQTGRVGHRSEFGNYDADDNDTCDVESLTRVSFRVPAQGSTKKWRFTIKALCQAARGLFEWWNEPGWSYASSSMRSNLYIAISTEPPTNLLSHPYERANIWHKSWSGNGDLYDPHEHFPKGTHRWYTWTSPFALPNQMAKVTIGAADYLNAYMDDMSVYMRMNNCWYIQQVSIELV